MAVTEFEEVLEAIGSFGPFQICVFVLVSMFETPAAWAIFLPVFVAAKPNWTCVTHNGSEALHMDLSTTPSQVNLSYPETSTDSGTANSSQELLSEAQQCLLYQSGQCQHIQYNSEYTSIISEWDLICDMSYVTPLITTLQMVGVLFGALITGQCADTLGRRKVLYGVYALFLTAGLASAFANSWQLYAACRMLVGAFFGGVMVVNFVLPLEFVGRQWRTFCGCIGFWACGLMSLAVIAYFLQEWRHLAIAVSLGGIPLLFTWWFVAESPRWLLLKGRFAEAEVILSKMAAWNKKPLPDLSRLQHFVEKETEKRQKAREHSYWDLFRSCHMAKNTLILLFAWFVSSSVYYGASLNAKNLTGSVHINIFLSGLVEIPPLIFVVLVNNRLGRRWTLFLLMMTAGASCTAILFVDVAGKLEEMPALTKTLALLGKSGIAGAWAASQVLSAEVFPTPTRNIGIAACSMAARMGGIVAPQIVFLTEVWTALPYVVFGVLAAVCAVLCTLLPETYNKPLEDTLPPRTLCLCLNRHTDTATAVPSNSIVPDPENHHSNGSAVVFSVNDGTGVQLLPCPGGKDRGDGAASNS